MSLSKPFRLLDLPLLPLEQVLLITEPRDLLLFALSSEKARDLFRKFSLVKYFDIDLKPRWVTFSICFKSGEPIKWEFIMKLPVNASEESVRLANVLHCTKINAHVFKLDDIRMVLFEHPYVMRCRLPKEDFLDYTQRIGHLFQSICPDQRIRKLEAGKVGWEEEKVFFHMDGITRCDKFTFDMCDGDKFLEILEKTDVKRKIILRGSRKVDSNLDWMNNEKIRNIPQLKLFDVRNLDSSQFLSLENEHLDLENCKVSKSAVNEYLKKWLNGEYRNRRTLRVASYHWYGLDDKVLNGLTPEPMETWEKLGKPGHVRFSDKLYLNPTPQKTHVWMSRTVLLRNCHGQFATVVQALSVFYFISWDHPLPPINIPKGHRLSESSDRPFAWVVPRNV